MSFFTFHPPFKADVVDDGGLITPAWRASIQNMFDTSGSADGQLVINQDSVVSTKQNGIINVSGDGGLIMEGVRWPDNQTLDGYKVFQYIGSSLDLIDGATLGAPSTGDVVPSIRTSKEGWLLMNDGTIGNAASGASPLASDTAEDLFKLLWSTVSDTYAPVSSGRGASAQADFAAGKTLTLPRALGRIMGLAGAGAGITERTIGEYTGTEDHTLTALETPAHSHTFDGFEQGAGTAVAPVGAIYDATPFGRTEVTGSTVTAHNNMMPTTFLNYFIKL